MTLYLEAIKKHLEEACAIYGALQDPALHLLVARAAQAINSAYRRGNRLYSAGNGGSAADAQHFAAELVGWYRKGNRPLSALALSTDTSFLTAWGNDYAFEHIFTRQLQAHAKARDVFVAISTSGNSANILRGLETARTLGVFCIGLLGCDGGKAKPLCDIALVIPSDSTPHIQEAHIAIIHTLCECIAR